MAIVYKFCTVLHDDCGVFTLQNNAVYGGAERLRSATGDVLISAHINEDETEDFATIDSTPYDSKISYDITNTLDGHYHSELLEFPNYNAGTAYIAEIRDVNSIITTYANLIYYPTTQKFYKNILASTGIAPDAVNGTTYWVQITNFTNSEVRLNTTIYVGVFDDIATCRSRKCVKNELIKLTSKDVSCLDEKTLLPYLKKKIYLSGAYALNSDQKSEQAEHVIRTLTKLCPC